MSKPRVIMWLAVAALAGAAFYVTKDRLAPGAAPPHGGAPAQTVAAQTAQKQSWQPTMELVDELVASEGADLSLQVSGIVESLSFESGQTVKAGTPLLQLVAEDQIAKLAALRATAELNAIILKRDIEQLKIKAVSQATVDTDDANPYGSTVFVLETTADGKGLVARETFVKLGEARGDFVAVVSGLTEGETVVVAGQIKLRNGTPALIDNSHLPKVELNPTVSD